MDYRRGVGGLEWATRPIRDIRREIHPGLWIRVGLLDKMGRRAGRWPSAGGRGRTPLGDLGIPGRSAMTRTQRFWLALAGSDGRAGLDRLAGRLGRRDARPAREGSRPSLAVGLRRRWRASPASASAVAGGPAALEARPRRAGRRPGPPRTSSRRPRSRPRRPRGSIDQVKRRGGPGPAPEASWPTLRADRQAAAVPRRRLRHRLGGQDLADQRPARPRVGATEAVMGTTRRGRDVHLRDRGRRRDRPPDRHAGPLRDRRRGGRCARPRPATSPPGPTCSCSSSTTT